MNKKGDEGRKSFQFFFPGGNTCLPLLRYFNALIPPTLSFLWNYSEGESLCGMVKAFSILENNTNVTFFLFFIHCFLYSSFFSIPPPASGQGEA